MTWAWKREFKRYPAVLQLSEDKVCKEDFTVMKFLSGF